MNKGKPENSFIFNITKNQEFELITSCHFTNPISPKPTWNSQWSLISSRNLKWWHHCPYLRDCWQITFVTLNRFCLLSNPPPLPTPFFWRTISWWIVYQTKPNEKCMPFLHYIMKVLLYFYIMFWRYFLQKFARQPPDFLFIVDFISFYTSRYYFSQIFRTSFSIIWKKDFRHEFSFFIRLPQTSTPSTAKIH